MTRIFASFVVMGLIAFSLGAKADVAPERLWSGAKCFKVQMCKDQSTNGVCTSGGDEVVVDLKGKYSYTLYSTQSTATSYTCVPKTNDVGYDASSGDGDNVSGTNLTSSNRVLPLSGLLDKVWIDCSGILGGNVTVTLLACPF